MARYDFKSPRLFVDAPMSQGTTIPLTRDQANYLVNVMRLTAGDAVLAFNGRDGEWRGILQRSGKKDSALALGQQIRPQENPVDLHYLFAPLKHARLDYMVQKAVELGVSQLRPVMTRHTQAARVNLERMRANVIEAAEQCGVLAVPEISEPVPFGGMLHALDAARVLIFCDEDAPLRDPAMALKDVPQHSPLAVLIGPEGGFSGDERAALLKRPNVIRLALGPRILRADTAAISALTLVQAALGDWKH